ncbi:MAG: DUF1836 domain-containing protein [Evtepia sp.]
MCYDQKLVLHKLLRWENYLNHFSLPDWKEIPNIGLYMDQLIALLRQYLDFISEQHDKPITPNTINNYVRLRVMPAPENRKYYRVHIAYLLMIFTLKQSIPIQSIQKMIAVDLTEEETRTLYVAHSATVSEVTHFFTRQSRIAAQDVLKPDKLDDTAVERLVTQAVLVAGFARLMAEKLIGLKNANTEESLAQEQSTLLP